MSAIYFARHGQSQANIKKVYAGWSNSPLTDFGREQAEKAGEAARNLGIQKIISSDLSRAYETACIIAKHIGIDQNEIIQDPGLREVGVGQLTNQPERGVPGTLGEALPGYSHYSKIKGNELGVELLGDVYERMRGFARELSNEYDHLIVLLVGHDISGLVLRQVLTGQIRDVFEMKPLKNATIVQFQKAAL